MKRIALFGALILLLLKFSVAQPALGVGFPPLTITPDSVTFNQTVQISVFIDNKGDTLFSGTFQLYISVNGDSATLLDTTHYFANLQSFDSIQVLITDYEITPPSYTIGDNIVVIWPVADLPGVPTTDSGRTHVHVDTALGLGPPLLLEQIKVYYRNSDHDWVIDYGSALSFIRDVTCYSILGQQISKYNYPVNQISFSQRSSQIALLVIRTKQGETISFKILRM
jgi:hypothetical protein